jgi:hypothetical protein
MQHHFLCNISYVAIAESMGKSLKYTTNNFVVHVSAVHGLLLLETALQSIYWDGNLRNVLQFCFTFQRFWAD